MAQILAKAALPRLRRIEEHLKQVQAAARVIPRAPRDGELPLSSAQERLWFLSRYEPRSFAYNCPEAVQLKGRLDVASLERALDAIVSRHEVLRTSFRSVGDRVVQHIAPAFHLELPIVDLSTSENFDLDVQRVVMREVQMPFDLARGPVVRARLLRRASDEHVLLWISHHVAYDGWSFSLFLNELAELYGAFTSGQEPVLPDLAVQYADFACWERSELQGRSFEDALAYWRRQLAGPLPILQLPSDRPRPVFQSYRGARLIGRLSNDTARELKALARSEGATLFMVLLAAFQALLCRYTGQHQIIVGSPIAHRLRPEFETLIGFFANMLALRADLSDDPTFRILLGRTRDVALEAFTHQHVPFGRLVETLQPARDVSRPPLFQVAFSLQNTPRPTRQMPGLEMTCLDIEAGLARYDLTLSMKETQDGLLQRFEYNTDLFDETTIARMDRHLAGLLRAVIENPDRRVSEYQYMAADERRELLVGRNQTRAELPRQQCVHELVEDQARRTPDAEALVFGRRRLTYAELDARADALASRLRDLGVALETPVAVCLARSPEMVVALLGILKAGGTYVPIDSTSPADRIAYILMDAGVRIVVTDHGKTVPLTTHPVDVVVLDPRDPVQPATATRRGVAVQPEHLANIMYTTGSTGRPKGVQVPHRALVNFLSSMRVSPGLAAGDTVLAITTIAFDIAALEIFLPLIVGARVVIASQAAASSPAALVDLLKTSGANVVQATPTMWRMLVEAGWTGRPDLKILCGGESLPRHLADALLCRAKEVWNLYGPTETAVWSSLARVEPGDGPISIGRPIANTELYVLDAKLQPVPVGVPGELFIGGLGVARGYLNKPDLTAQKFVPNPFGAAGSRLFRTGDMVRSLADGGIQFLGRLDHQVKIRGFRIELEGIEAVLRTHPKVKTAIVVARDDSSGHTRLIAYVVPGEAHVYVDELRELLQNRLPSYCMPGAFVFLNDLPLTANGKLDRSALPEPEMTRPSLEPAFVPPRDDIERQLADMWSRLLGVSAVGVRDSFFELGGHSVLALRLFGWIEQQFGRSLPTSALFESPTIEHLAGLLKCSGSGFRGCLVPLQPLGPKPPLFCVHGVDGHVLGYQALAQLLAPTQPVFGIQAPAEGCENIGSMEALAARYVSELRAVQPTGPYFLGGHSFGGMVAFEMARQLEASGETVGLLALFDTRRGDFGDGITSWGRFRATVQNLWHLPGLQKLRYLAEKVHAYAGGKRGFAAEAGDRNSTRLQAYQLARSYAQRPYAGRAILFRADQGLEAYRADRLDWREIVLGGVEYVRVPGGHDDMLGPAHVREVGATLRERLNGSLSTPDA